VSGKKSRNRRLTMAELNQLTSRASRGDRAAMLRLRQLIRANREQLQNLIDGRCRTARGVHTAGASCDQPVRALAIEAHLDLLRSDLAAEGNSRVEQLLIDRVAMCWLTLHTLEEQAARERLLSPGEPPAWDKAIDHAHRRFLQAITESARLRMADRLEEIDTANEVRHETGAAHDDRAE